MSAAIGDWGRAVVTKPVPDYAIAVGVPARVVAYRKRSESREEQASRLNHDIRE